ncbi:hypothetical protein PGRAT_23790 [Paenibacillus graminis]|uniref:Uncharacterized protein n=1 Tax=Paenibacillus graminis TaxID=189425 RepID=A0A089MD83_9BACL|nr:hypothetical protein PGRAT_23790 [Paenibacillus graminis]
MIYLFDAQQIFIQPLNYVGSKTVIRSSTWIYVLPTGIQVKLFKIFQLKITIFLSKPKTSYLRENKNTD